MGTGLPGDYIHEFRTGGVFVNRVATNGALNAPWGMALAPAGFGSFGGDLLVGNFGNQTDGLFGEIATPEPGIGALACYRLWCKTVRDLR